MTFEEWWEEFTAEHDEWRYADSAALRRAAFQAGAASRDAEIAELVAALECVLPWVITQTVACCGLKCREQVCISCEGEEDAEKNAQIACEKYHIAQAALAKVRKP